MRNLWQKLSGNDRRRSVATVADRFLQAFRDHGVEPSQIPRLLPQVKFADLQSPEHLLAVLTPEILKQTAGMFGIRLEWLEGVDETIYDYLCVCKEPATLLRHLEAIAPRRSEYPNSPLRVLTTAERQDRKNPGLLELTPVLLEKIGELGEEDIYRYHVYRDGFYWGDLPARLELKAIARVVFKKLRVPVPLFVVSADEMQEVSEGRAIPRRHLCGCLLTEPSLEDFALSRTESVIAKEVDELPAVLRYIEDERLMDIPLVWKDEVVASEAASPAAATMRETPTNSGKRDRMRAEWDKVRTFAKACWAEDQTTLIEDMVRRIKGNPAFKVAALSESAIRKHIADLAPPGVRGKSGRKPKKSS